MTTASIPAPAAARLAEFDMLRGIVIILMALDHARDYFHAGGFRTNPLDPETTTPLLYLTRWITHLCAPAFIFLAGLSAFLQARKGKTGAALARFLLTRGLWLIFIEVTVLSFGWSFGFPYPFFLQVIWAIGWSMIALAALVLLPRTVVLAIGLVIVIGHNLLDPLTPQQFGGAALVWSFLHEGGPIFIGGQPIGILAYPVLPWIGVMAIGYGAGPLFVEPAATRDRKLVFIGAAMLSLFLLLRFTGFYGEPQIAAATGNYVAAASWRDQTTLGAQIMMFLNVQKYPPSLLFLLVTLGVCALLLPLLSRLKGPPAKILLTFGAVPFFFYVLHVYVAHALAIAANAAAGHDVDGLFNYLINAFLTPQKLAGLGFDLPGVYLGWIAILAILYPACRWFAAIKKRRKDWWLSYL